MKLVKTFTVGILFSAAALANSSTEVSPSDWETPDGAGYFRLLTEKEKGKYEKLSRLIEQGNYDRALAMLTEQIKAEPKSFKLRVFRGNVSRLGGKREVMCTILSKEAAVAWSLGAEIEMQTMCNDGWLPEKGSYPYNKHYSSMSKAQELSRAKGAPNWVIFFEYDQTRKSNSIEAERKVARRVLETFPREFASKLCWAKSLLKGIVGSYQLSDQAEAKMGKTKDLIHADKYVPADDWSKYRESEGIDYLKKLLAEHGPIIDIFYWLGYGYGFRYDRSFSQADKDACKTYFEKYLAIPNNARITKEHKEFAKAALQRLEKQKSKRP